MWEVLWLHTSYWPRPNCPQPDYKGSCKMCSQLCVPRKRKITYSVGDAIMHSSGGGGAVMGLNCSTQDFGFYM